jgi:hypothetical protein
MRSLESKILIAPLRLHESCRGMSVLPGENVRDFVRKSMSDQTSLAIRIAV